VHVPPVGRSDAGQRRGDEVRRRGRRDLAERADDGAGEHQVGKKIVGLVIALGEAKRHGAGPPGAAAQRGQQFGLPPKHFRFGAAVAGGQDEAAPVHGGAGGR
jgi:hypothetical protein